MADAVKIKVGAVVPPKVARGKRGTQIPKEVITAFLEGLASRMEDDSPAWISDQVPYDTRAKANAAVSKYKRALVDDADSSYTDTKQIASRVWPTGEPTADGKETGPFYFALAERAAE